MSKQGHNSGEVGDQIKELAVRYAKADAASMELNDERAEIREEIKELGLDTKAWQDCIARAKQSLKKREGYDESITVITNALGQMEMADLFKHVDERAKAKAADREEKAAERAKESADRKAAKKANDDTFKPATERSPGAVKKVGKDAAAGPDA